MPFGISTFRHPNLALFRFWGDLTKVDTRDCILQYLERADFDDARPILVDAAMITSTIASFADLLSQAAAHQSALARFTALTTIATICANETHFGTVRMLAQAVSISSKLTIHPVWTVTEACAVIGLTEPLPPEIASLLSPTSAAFPRIGL